MLVSAKANYYVSLIKSQSDNPRQLWDTINSVSGNARPRILPDHVDPCSLVNDCNLFFTTNVTHIRDIMGMPDHIDDSGIDISSTVTRLSSFQEVHESDV